MEETYKGFRIRYDEVLGTFIAAIGEGDYRNQNLASVKKYIDGLDRKDFKRVDVDSGRLVRDDGGGRHFLLGKQVPWL